MNIQVPKKRKERTTFKKLKLAYIALQQAKKALNIAEIEKSTHEVMFNSYVQKSSKALLSRFMKEGNLL